VTILELAPAADELWVLDCDSWSGYLWHDAGMVALPDVARGAKIRPRVKAAYASGKATNVGRVFDAFLRDDAATPLAQQAQQSLAARLITFLPGAREPYRRPEIPGSLLGQFTPGGAYLACLLARDLWALELELVALPACDECQVDRRCANLVGCGADELVNFSPYLYWERTAAEAVLAHVGQLAACEWVSLAGSLPLVDAAPCPTLYAEIIAALRAAHPGVQVCLDVGGAALRACLEGGSACAPDVVTINTDEFRAAGVEAWEHFAGAAVVHDKRGCWLLQGEELRAAARWGVPEEPHVAVPPDVQALQTICAGDAAHGGLLLGLALWGVQGDLLPALQLSQACALAVVENTDGIRGLSAQAVERNLRRLQ
jgi:fructose-1-phosphate kinase PfkB-like protein